jgi:hypothetical protein
MSSLAPHLSWKKPANLLRYAVFAGIFGLGVASCDQTEGERCEIDSDCSSDLMCQITAGNGICRARGSSNTGGTDGSTTPDAVVGLPDSGVDTRVVVEPGVDSGAGDAGVDAAVGAPDAVDVPPEARPDSSAPDATPDATPGATIDGADGRVDQAG